MQQQAAIAEHFPHLNFVVIKIFIYCLIGSPLPAFPQISATQTAITVTEANSATLSCTATGDPFPTISWLRNGVIIQPGMTGFQFLASGQTLVIGSVTESAHEGGYTCRATNMLGVATASITLSVLGEL